VFKSHGRAMRFKQMKTALAGLGAPAVAVLLGLVSLGAAAVALRDPGGSGLPISRALGDGMELLAQRVRPAVAGKDSPCAVQGER
jgi:hypothetical protein